VIFYFVKIVNRAPKLGLNFIFQKKIIFDATIYKLCALELKTESIENE